MGRGVVCAYTLPRLHYMAVNVTEFHHVKQHHHNAWSIAAQSMYVYSERTTNNGLKWDKTNKVKNYTHDLPEKSFNENGIVIVCVDDR